MFNSDPRKPRKYIDRILLLSGFWTQIKRKLKTFFQSNSSKLYLCFYRKEILHYDVQFQYICKHFVKSKIKYEILVNEDNYYIMCTGQRATTSFKSEDHIHTFFWWFKLFIFCNTCVTLIILCNAGGGDHVRVKDRVNCILFNISMITPCLFF